MSKKTYQVKAGSLVINGVRYDEGDTFTADLEPYIVRDFYHRGQLDNPTKPKKKRKAKK